MITINRRNATLALLIALPIAIASLVMLWSSYRMLDGIAHSVDQQEATRTWQAVQSAMAATQERLAGTVTDNAHWDDAVQQSYGTVDPEWMYDTWGVGTADINYDTMYLVDPAGSVIAAFQGGEINKIPAADYYGKSLQRTLDELPMNGSTFGVLSSLVETPQGLAVMAAAPILATSEDIKIPTERPNVLIFSKLLTKPILEKMSEQYIVDGLQLAPITTRAEMSADNALLDHWGNPVALASWQARHPGDLASESYQFSALATILALIGVMTPLALAYGRAISRMDNNERLARIAARQDALSGLPNRVFLLDDLTKQLAVARDSELALIFVDLDGFKAVNDAYDHETGDKLIRAVASGLKTVVGGEGLIARIGGDEFAVLVAGKDAAARSESIATRALDFVKEPFDIDGRIASIGASIGIAELGPEPLDPSELMRRADIAMYDAKDSGRNRWRRFDQTLDLKRIDDITIANEMRAFIARGEFDVAYQPMVDSRDRAIIGVEALARWPKSSSRGLSPERFIPVAEEHGLIDSLGALILKIACRDMMQWRDLRLAVNISPIQINNPLLVPDIRRVAEGSGLPLERLEVEFTETVLIKNPARAKQVIRELQSLGVTVALDDFGTGYASVGYLREYGFNKIKLDRSLTHSISTDIAAQQVVQGTILIAKGLSANIIAEGVETEEEAQLMRLSGCNQLQGFYFGRPQAANALVSLLSNDVEDMSYGTA
jgi:diguanylate cyclase (GGDEF)-like protein